jgi:hypothetical protein
MECDAAAALPGTASASGSAHAHVHLKPTAAVGKESHKETDRAFAFGPDPAALQPLIIEICAILAEVKRRLRMFAASVALSGAVSPRSQSPPNNLRQTRLALPAGLRGIDGTARHWTARHWIAYSAD